jgi:integrase
MANAHHNPVDPFGGQRPACSGRGWLRLYQQQMRALVSAGPDDPLWWTLRRPFRPLGYHAARAMFVRANDAVGTGWTLHDLRHFYASCLIAANLNPKVIQARLGHATMAETMDTYGNTCSPTPKTLAGGIDAILAQPPTEQLRNREAQ